MSTHAESNVNFAELCEPEFWRTLAPALHISEPGGAIAPALGFDADTLSSSAQLFSREGYVQLPPAGDAVRYDAMRAIIADLQQRQLPPVFAFIFDECWLAFFELRGLIKNLLGADYCLLPDFWAWHVDPAAAQSGWTPHRDKGRASLFADGYAKSLTVWIPLSEATPVNGCMYIVPADRNPSYDSESEHVLQFQLQDIRALPAAAGSILIWNQAVLHWGGRSAQRPSAPRISIALECQRRDVAPFNEPLLEPDVLPSIALRLKLIGRQLLRYQHMHALKARERALGEFLSAL